MKKGDAVCFYHSVTDKEVVGIARVAREFYPDATATEGDWSCVDLGAFVNALFALCVMVYAAGKLQLHPQAVQIIGFLALCGVGILIHYSLMFILATISFWTVRAQGIVWGYYNLFNIARMPDEAFRGAFKGVFTFALPVLLVSNVPTRVLADKASSPASWALLLGLGLVWAGISEWFWRLSVRRYTSASS